MKSLLLTLAVLLTTWAAPALAEIKLDHPAYAFRTAPNQSNGAAFFVLENYGADDIAIIGVTSDIASMTEIHTMDMTDGIMKMREVDRLTIPAGGLLTLDPTGNHIMFMGLTTPLELDATFPLTLTLSNGQTMEIPVTVVNPGFTHEKSAKPKDAHADHTDH